MADVLYLLVIVAFFGLMVLLVKACDHIIAPDDVGSPATRDTKRVMTADNIVGLIIAVLLAVYLIASLVFPERF